jgi:alpha-D-ribose 1-methylphosphonate 5-triphosphate synthase subunit PhnL
MVVIITIHLQSLLIGQDKEIAQIVDDVKNNKSSSWLLTGESGIGKSAFLDKLYKNLINDKDMIQIITSL